MGPTNIFAPVSTPAESIFGLQGAKVWNSGRLQTSDAMWGFYCCVQSSMVSRTLSSVNCSSSRSEVFCTSLTRGREQVIVTNASRPSALLDKLCS